VFSSDEILLAFPVLLGVQYLHSIEELCTGFHRKWYLFKMPFLAFVCFEILFLSFWTFIGISPDLLFRKQLMLSFNCLMLINGIQHLLWAASKKQYVPGLMTAPFFIIILAWVHL
jgi:hypothetical protein